MSKGMSKELKQEICDVLLEAINRQPGSSPIDLRGNSDLRGQAIRYLVDKGAFATLGDSYPAFTMTRLTAYGRELYDELTSPVKHWLKKSWFRVAGLVVTLILGLTAIIANVIF